MDTIVLHLSEREAQLLLNALEIVDLDQDIACELRDSLIVRLDQELACVAAGPF